MARQRGGNQAGGLPASALPPPPAPACARPDTAGLLGRLADALNACERAGLPVELDHGGALTAHGYVLPIGDARIGSRWQARPRLDPDQPVPPSDGPYG